MPRKTVNNMVKSTALETDYVQMSTLPVISCMTIIKSLTFSLFKYKMVTVIVSVS